jgi:hypothetical protein
MPVLRVIKSEYEFFYNEKLDVFVALDAENSEALSNYWKAKKGKQKAVPSVARLKGYKLIFDEEFQSLKIDFSNVFQFDANYLQRTKLE